MGSSSAMLPTTRPGRIKVSCVHGYGIWQQSVLSVRASYKGFPTSVQLDPQYACIIYFVHVVLVFLILVFIVKLIYQSKESISLVRSLFEGSD